jgi:dienelactone hydrolase
MDRDGAAYVDFLSAHPSVKGGRIGVVGYCFTGALALRTAAARPDRVGAAASLHGGGLANVYVSVNAVRPGQLTRTRRAIRDVGHIFAEADHDGKQVVRTIEGRLDLPRPSYLLHSSPNRVHIFWRASGFGFAQAERLSGK